MIKTCINISALLIKQVEKVKIFTLLLTIGTLTPVVTNANNRDELKVLSIEKEILVEMDKDDYLYDLCNKWKLSKKDITRFFLTAQKSINSTQIDSFDLYNCEIQGELLVNGIKKEYQINLGGLAAIRERGGEEIEFGCSKGECLKYVYYES